MLQFKSLRVAVAIAAGALMLGACETATPYQPIGTHGTGASGGFSDVQIAPNRYRVTFAGNAMTSRERVEIYLLYRAAELTVERGFDSFTIVDRATDRNVETRVYRDPFGPGPYRYWRPYWRYRGAGFGWHRWDPWFGDPWWGDQIDVSTIQRFEASAEIVVSRGNTGGDKSFNAREVIANLGPTIELPR